MRLIVALAVLAAVILAVWLIVGAWNGWQKGRTAKRLQNIEKTTTQAQSSLDDQAHQKEVETIIREPIIIERTVRQAERIREIPSGQQLAPTLDALCLSRLYADNPLCADRVQSAGAGEEDLQPGPAAADGG
jgi:hypothetical protein